MTPAELWSAAADVDFLGNSLDRWLMAAGAGIVAYLLLRVTLRIVLQRFKRLAERSATRVDDVVVEVLAATRMWVLFAVAVLVFCEMLELSPRWQGRVSQLWFVVMVVQLALWVSRGVGLLLNRHLLRHGQLSQEGASATLLSWGLQTALWTTVVLAVLANLGVNITALVASLGVGGIAVALAVQNILGDLFASLAIALDKPFEVGDAIAVGGVSGTVERVGLKTTRIRAHGGEQIVMSNADLLKSAVSNYKRQERRRVVFKFSVSLETSAEQARAIPDIVREVIETREDVTFDRAHLQRIGDGALEYEVVYIVQRADYKYYMDLQQEICLSLIERLQALSIEFAAPKTVLAIPEAAKALVEPRPFAVAGMVR
ncbi:MAG TPA: mechanosensitive ion channel family protein [Ideonella sp.]|uniref:mechanosensitive ion channel family protein n=1 Tax=Ideonella sp. TaxID=1929293 RepID=UPI002E2FA76B|nr:mechanosensitive ion channel family protein [Ideonella sp.]HEX5686432.1 mechanosensitive ion channel family protein [Ideonella sp.]